MYSLQVWLQQSIATFKILEVHQDLMSLPRLPGSFRADSISFRKSRNEHFVVPNKSWRSSLEVVYQHLLTCTVSKSKRFLQYIHIYQLNYSNFKNPSNTSFNRVAQRTMFGKNPIFNGKHMEKPMRNHYFSWFFRRSFLEAQQ